MRISEEPFSRWCREAVDGGLFEAHWREIGRDREKIQLEPDFDKFHSLERIGALVCFSAREDGTGAGKGALLGYAVYLCTSHLHYKSHRFAYADMIYLVPEARAGWNGANLVRFAERALAARGVSKIIYHLKLSHDFSPLLERLGYEPSEKLLEKLLV